MRQPMSFNSLDGAPGSETDNLDAVIVSQTHWLTQPLEGNSVSLETSFFKGFFCASEKV